MLTEDLRFNLPKEGQKAVLMQKYGMINPTDGDLQL